MMAEKQRRVATAAGFLLGVLACVDVLRDDRVLWPPDALWASLGSPQHLKLGMGIALILLSLLGSVLWRNN